MTLDKPLVVFDIESTGINPRADRIIEMAAIRIFPDGGKDSKEWLLNPGIPIPIESTAIHGIEDAHVASCPTFRDIAYEVNDYMRDYDLAGFNHIRFDVPLLVEEFLRVGMIFDIDCRRLIDAQRIFHKREPRDLTAAVKFYCNEEFTDAHGAKADAEATLRVLEGQFVRYPDLPRDPDELDRLLNERDPFFVDRVGRLRWVDGEMTINFGKRQGQKVRDLVVEDPAFLRWILRSDFPRDTQRLIEEAMENRWPTPPPVTPTSRPETAKPQNRNSE